MTPYKQLVDTDPSKDRWGDCYRTAIGCLLDMPPDQVPNVNEQRAGKNIGGGEPAMRKWLATKGLGLVDLPTSIHKTVGSLLSAVGAWNPDFVYVLIGRSDGGIGHAVVCKGSVILHDPSNRNAGIAGPLEGRFYVQFLVPLAHSQIRKP